MKYATHTSRYLYQLETLDDYDKKLLWRTEEELKVKKVNGITARDIASILTVVKKNGDSDQYGAIEIELIKTLLWPDVKNYDPIHNP